MLKTACLVTSPWLRLLWILAAVLFLEPCRPLAGAHAEQLTEREKRGKQVYIQTTSPSGGEIKAFVGKSMMEAPGASLPCINCHGYDGVGLVESGVTATTIIWEELTKPYGLKHPTGREHSPYTEESLARAISEGMDPAGNPLDVSMPRYTMPAEDLADLVAYIKRIGNVLDPGLTETSIKVGTFLPLTGRLAGTGKAMDSVLRAFFSDLNRGGGVYNRKIDLEVLRLGESPTAVPDAARELMTGRQAFALVSPFIAGADRKVAELAEQNEVPVFGPFTLHPEEVALLNRFTFYLYSGLREQARALVIHAEEKLKGTRAPFAIVTSRETESAVVESAEKQARKLGWKSVVKFEFSGDAAEAQGARDTMAGGNVGAVLVLGSWDAFKTLLRESEKPGWNPLFLLPGSAARSDVFELPEVFSSRVFLSYPTVPSDRTEAGTREFNRFHATHQLPTEHVAAQISAYCAAKVFVEGLKRTGRKLSREKLIAAMDRMTQFNTGLTPKITYDPNRRIGAYGAHVLGVDLRKKGFSPDGGWIELEIL